MKKQKNRNNDLILKGDKMKKTILTILFCGVMVLGIAGCGNKEENKKFNDDTNVNNSSDNSNSNNSINNNDNTGNTKSNTLTCIGPGVTQSNCSFRESKDSEITVICYAYGKTEMIFTYDQNKNITKIIMTESYKESELASSDISKSEFKSDVTTACQEANAKDGMSCKTDFSNGISFTMEITDISNMKNLFDVDLKTIDEVDEFLNSQYYESKNEEMKYNCN